MDFTIKVLASDPQDRTASVELVPDLRRYDRVTVDGEVMYRDKFLRHLVRLEDMMASIGGVPIFQLSSSVESTHDYAKSRREAVAQELVTGIHSPPAERALQHRKLELDPTKRGVAFLSVDICGATALRAQNSELFERAHRILVQELGTLVGQCNGSILKLTGDGFIACIDHPSFTSVCDTALDLGTSLHVLLQETVNPALATAGLPQFQIRIGGDFGEIAIRDLAIPATGFSEPEIASDALNRAVKLQETCQPNEFRIGRELFELVHVAWLERSTEVEFDGKIVGLPSYNAYRVV